MPFDGIFLEKMIKELEFLKGGKINKMTQISDSEFLLNIRANYSNHFLMISLHPEFSRVHLTKTIYDSPQTPTGLTMFFRKHIEGSIIKDITQHNVDRIITFDLIGTNDLGDKIDLKLIVEIMGRISNLIITNNDKIMECWRHLSPFDGNYRTIIPTAKYIYPTQDKKDYKLLTNEQLQTIIDNKSYMRELSGVSRQLSIFLNDISSVEYFNNIINKNNPTLITGTKTDFYFFDLTYIEGERKEFDSLSSLLDSYFYEKDKRNRIKQKSNDLETLIKRHLDKNKNKLEKLQNELSTATNNEIYKIKGELLLANLYQIQKERKISVLNYYTNEFIEIELDPLLTPIANANKYFHKYQKMKKSLQHINQQIENTIEEINYFQLLETQIETADVNTSLEMKSELEDYGYLKKYKTNKKKKLPAYETYEFNNATIYVGKNNQQNAYLTHKVAYYNDYWFHVKDMPGSHVILRGEMTEANIRFAANLACYNSKAFNSSSVAVDYTQIKNIKKIPGRHNCFVTYTNQKTIYIDPDINLINEYKKTPPKQN